MKKIILLLCLTSVGIFPAQASFFSWFDSDERDVDPVERFVEFMNDISWFYREAVQDALTVVPMHNGKSVLVLAEAPNKGDITEIPGIDPDTGLKAAVWYGHVESALAFIQKGANINRTDPDYKWTPLFWAVYWKNPAIVQVLIEAGANLNLKDYKAFTPLVWARKNNDLTIMNQLLRAGADQSALQAYDQRQARLKKIIEDEEDAENQRQFMATLIEFLQSDD